MPSRWSDWFSSPLSKALLVSLAVHLLAMTAVGVVLPTDAGESGIAPKKLEVWTVVRTDQAVTALSEVQKPSTIVPDKSDRPTKTSSSRYVFTGDEDGAIAVARQNNPVVQSAPPLPVASVEKAAVTPNAALPGAGQSSVETTRRDPEPLIGDGEILAGYRLGLARQTRKLGKIYPRGPEELGIGGRTEIEVRQKASGQPEVRIKRGSGNEELDFAALNALQYAVKSTEIPAALIGRNFIVVLPVEFSNP